VPSLRRLNSSRCSIPREDQPRIGTAPARIFACSRRFRCAAYPSVFLAARLWAVIWAVCLIPVTVRRAYRDCSPNRHRSSRRRIRQTKANDSHRDHNPTNWHRWPRQKKAKSHQTQYRGNVAQESKHPLMSLSLSLHISWSRHGILPPTLLGS
jgi:hypothetical protein